MKIVRCVGGGVAAFGLIALGAFAQSAALRVTNPDAVARTSEVVDVPMQEVVVRLHLAAGQRVVAHVHVGGKVLLTQAYASIVDGPKDRLLVLVDLAPRQTEVIDLSVAGAENAPLESRVTARDVPERMDDFAWENDVVAFRTYGPALQATGEITSGIDVWSKRVPTFVTTSWYKRAEEGERTHNPALSYHRDNGEGLDSYDVGPSRGCGGTAVFVDGKLFPSKNFTSTRILADGPIRVDFLLHYAEWGVGEATVGETKRITLDAGARLNRMRSTFTVSGTPEVTIAAGVAMHDGSTMERPDAGIVSVWDTPQTASAGRIGTALLVKRGVPKFVALPIEGKVAGNAVFAFPVKDGGTIDYYAGAAWSKAGVPTQAAFDEELKTAQERLERPVVVRWDKSVGVGK